MIYLLHEGGINGAYDFVAAVVGIAVLTMLALVLLTAILLVCWKWWTEWRFPE